MQWASVGHGRCRALQRTERDLHRDRAASAVRGAPTHASHALLSYPSSLLPTLEAHCIVATHYLLLPAPFSLLYAVCVRRARQMPCLAEDREGFTQGSRGFCRARRAHARHPRTPLFSLLPIPYFGSPLHSGHALPSYPSSLLPTLRSERPSGTADAVPCRGQRGIYTGIARLLPCEARPRAPATHYLLIPPPFSLLWKPTA